MEWILKILTGIDQLGNAIAGGNPDALISARVGYFANKEKTKFHVYWQFLERVIDYSFLPVDGPRHCLRKYLKDKDNKFKHGSDFAKALLGIIIIFSCIFIAIFLRIITFIFPSLQHKLESDTNDETCV